MKPNDELLSMKQVQELMKISESTLRRAVKKGCFPRPFYSYEGSNRPRWLRSEVEAHMEAQRRKVQ